MQQDVLIPRSTHPLPVEVHPDGINSIAASIQAPLGADLRILMRQTVDGKPLRSSAGAPPTGKSLGKLLRLEANQGGRELPIRINYDKALWSGLSWAVGEIGHNHLEPGLPVRIRCSSAENQRV